MIVNYNYIKDEENNVLVYTYTDEKGITTEKRIPIFDENGNFTKEFEKEVQKKKAKRFFPELNEEKNSKNDSSDIIEEIPEQDIEVVNNSEVIEPEINDDYVQETALAVVEFKEADEELKNKKKFTWKKVAKWLGICVAGGVIVFGVSKLAGCNEGKTVVENTTPTPTPEDEKEEQIVPTPGPTATPVPTIEELKQDTRYTEITKEDFEKTIDNVVCEFKSHGIELNGEDVLNFVTFANFTHLKKTNPELLYSILGENVDEDQFIQKTGQIIGQIATLEVGPENVTVDWTVCFMDETDKQVAKYYVDNVLIPAKMYADGNPIKEDGTYFTREEKTDCIQSIIRKEFIEKEFSPTPNYVLANGNVITASPEIGAHYIIRAIMSGIPNNDTNIKQYIKDDEIINDLKVIGKNRDILPNLKALMKNHEECDKDITIASTEICGEKVKIMML